MPFRDHFRSPVNDTHSWDELHGGWPAETVRSLRDILPNGFRSGPFVRIGQAFEMSKREPASGGTALATEPAPTLTVEADLSEHDVYEVQIYDTERGRTLVAVIEIVSPSNKDRPKARDVFIGKLLSLLEKDVCVSIVDPVTIRQSNLYAELLERLDRSDPALEPVPPHTYAVTLRARKPEKRRPQLDAWFYPMIVGQPLPTLPIWLTPELRVMLPLETGYEEACSVLGIA